jgi:hypothetical protein
MELKTYTAEESNRYIGATGILGEVVARCAKLSYDTDNEEIQAAILDFESPYAIWRNTLKIADKEAVDRVYTDVKPLIDNNRITLDYILERSPYALVS